MAPAEVWCNEAQERYVLAVLAEDLPWFTAVCERERCPFAVIGVADDSGRLVVGDRLWQEPPVDMPLEVLLGKPPRTVMRATRRPRAIPAARLGGMDLEAASACCVSRRWRITFLIHIGDRTVGGMASRDQLVGPGVPVGDVVTRSVRRHHRRSMAIGERTPWQSSIRPPRASCRGDHQHRPADIHALETVRLSANWMAACGIAGEDEAL
jgi:phosphoribosylformylglycinamidine synthase